MKVFILCALFACAFACKTNYFTTGNDYLDVDEVMKHPEQMRKFINCYVDAGPCDALSKSYKDIIPEAISGACHRCNDAQKHLWSRFLFGLHNLYPDLYQIFQEKYDPEKKYLNALEKAVQGY